MNIVKINANSNKVGQNRYQAPNKQVNFTGAPKVTAGMIEKEISPLMPKSIQAISKLGSNVSELQDIIINSLGTGLVAPIFIKWNPLSKTDEDTRTYSAWRQPVSAVLAIVTQGFITIPFNHTIKNMTNSGWFGEKYNQTPFMDDDYIKKQIKKNKPGLTKEQLELEIEQVKTKQKNELLRAIKEDNTVYFQYSDSKTRKMNENTFKANIKDTIADLIKGEEEELKKCQEIKIPQRVERSDYYRRNPEKAKKLVSEIQQKLNNTSNLKEIKKFLSSKANELKGKKDDKCLLDIITELQDRILYGNNDEVHKSLCDKINKIPEHISMYESLGSKAEVEALVKKNLKERHDSLTESISNLKKYQTKLLEGETVGNIEKLIENHVKKNPKSRLKNLVLSEKIAERIKNTIKNNIKGYQRLIGLFVALAMLPVSCSLLNWVYPRFMDAVFPNLSNKKHSNEAKDFIDKANKNGEVK